MIYLYTEAFYATSKLKRVLKRFLGREIRGPQAVERSLISGMADNHQPFKVNQPLGKAILTAGVLSNAQTLRWAISQKQKGLIKNIVAGPNIAISPKDDGGIWRNPLLDIIIVPSEWVKDHYISEAPELEKKIRVWSAGVDLPKDPAVPKQYDFLVFNKISNGALYEQVVDYLKHKGFKVVVLKYGNFKQSDYFKLLDKSKYEIYLSESESQGLSMFEAWARNVPTFIWERGYWETKTYRWDGLTASPYLAPEAGMSFKDFEAFAGNLVIFMKGMYTPRKYIQDNFTNSISAQKYFEIYNSVSIK